MALALPGPYLKPDRGRQLKTEHNRPFCPIVHELHPPLTVHSQRRPSKLALDHRRVLRLLVKRLQQLRDRPDLLVPVIERPVHGVVVYPNVVVRVPGGGVERYMGVVEPGGLAQTRDRELLDVKPGSVGTEADPKNESYHTDDEEESQEDGAYELGDAGSEAIADQMGVVAGGVVALEGSRV